MALEMAELLSRVRDYADLAVHFDSQGNKDAAVFYYQETAALIVSATSCLRSKDVDQIKLKAEEYSKRAEELLALKIKEDSTNLQFMPKAVTDLERAYFLLSQGLDLDEDGKVEEAIELYSEAVELCIKAKSTSSDDDTKKKLGQVAVQALERAESLKGIDKNQAAKPQAPVYRFDRLHVGEVETDRHEKSTSKPSAGGGGGLTAEEIRVLTVTSKINGREYLPFTQGDLKERFAFPMPFSDKHGKLALSAKQTSKLVRWARPEEFIQDPKIIMNVSCFSVKQTVISDCSFIASIAISAQYEKKYGKKLITSLIYPQDKNKDPVYNPCGKYMVKLRINGISRKVLIDDYFPLGSRGEMLCSCSSNKSELWISILEKAYMKVMGGYDFPGSNSNIDLYVLTGWIPERVSIHPRDGSSFNKDHVFKMIWQRFHRGDVLVTVATGEMSDAAADRAGLVPTHAYALLDIREVDGIRLFMLKNPWSHLRWKGNYSEFDTKHWTSVMKRALDYDPKNAQNFDNGVFWIDYDSMIQFFDVIYMNWNPELFANTYSIHNLWNAGVGPAKDMYNLSANPQYSLELKGSSEAAGAVWILLSRHITDIEDFKNNKEYITLLVYKNNGKRVYYPYDPEPFIDGVRINSPHYLCKMEIGPKSARKYTLVVSQYEKSTTIYYTIKIFSTIPFDLKKVSDPPMKHKQEITGQWKGKSAGGCGNYRDTYPNNPRYQFTTTSDIHLLVELKGPVQYPIGFDLVCLALQNNEDKSNSKYFKMKQSGPYRKGYVMLLVEVLAGTYDIIPTTFRPGQESAFFLTVQSSSQLKLTKL